MLLERIHLSCVLVLVGIILHSESLSAQKRTINAYKLNGTESIELDGIANDEVWKKAEKVSGLIQRFPNDGKPASERTEFSVAYDDKYLYVLARAYDSSPDSIAATLFRRDGDEYSDWLYVSIDSYNDKRTAFTFAVNPKGVQKDIFYYNDNEEDVKWDAVWEAVTTQDALGWTAEFKIPLSQLRFTSSSEIQNWGINFQRIIARKEETAFWSPTPREENGLVSLFGELRGIRDLPRPMRLELLPYVSVSDQRAPKPEPSSNGFEDPFFKQNDFTFKAGGDIKYGITSDFTLTATINPDFGQVEADPATINLTEFETFFEERRPFFLEGSDIFSFGGTNSKNTYATHQTFYSRRIGRDPYKDITGAGINADFEDIPYQTTIAGAAKISGKTRRGLSVGFLDAYTLRERASYLSSTGTEGEITVEPPTNYMVTRLKQDLKGGDAQIGGFLSTVNRTMSSDFLKDRLHKSAYQAGLDGGYTWDNRNWGMSASFAVSQVNGSNSALIGTQTTSARYYNRVDSDYLNVDPNKTSLSGYSGEFSIGKYGGTGLRYSFTYSESSPGYEINDIGFQERADYRAPHYYLEYLNVDPDFFRFYLLWAYAGHAWNFDGDLIMNFYAQGGYFQFKNLWSVTLLGGFTGTFYNDRIARGGPIMRRPKDWNSYIEIASNSTKDLYYTFGGSYRADASGEYMTTLFGSLNYRPTGYLQFSVKPTFVKEHNTDQYQFFFDVDADPEADYVFSDSRFNIFYTEFRLNWAFTPKLSLQTYMRPLFYTADFSRYKTFEERKTYNFQVLDQATQDSFESLLDFDYRIIQGNAVLRWEYRPGSTIFLVWQQEKEQFLDGQSFFEPFRNTPELLKEKPINIFLLKFSYWFGS